jgi:hypothetical protein
MMMTIDKLIEELQLMKTRGMDGSTKVYVWTEYDHLTDEFTVRVDGDGDVILE